MGMYLQYILYSSPTHLIIIDIGISLNHSPNIIIPKAKLFKIILRYCIMRSSTVYPFMFSLYSSGRFLRAQSPVNITYI